MHLKIYLALRVSNKEWGPIYILINEALKEMRLKLSPIIKRNIALETHTHTHTHRTLLRANKSLSHYPEK